MGNTMVSPCFQAGSVGETTAKLVFWGGATRLLPGRQIAGELMFQFPDCIVCHANSFYIGHRVPALDIGDELLGGETYFVLPADRLPCSTLTAASLALLSYNRGRRQGPAVIAGNGSGQCPFEYVKGGDGRAHIKILPEFIGRMISNGGGVGGGEEKGDGSGGASGEICSTPELRKHYELLVGSRSRAPWSPGLETITERKVRLSPSRFLGFDRR